MPLGMHHWHFHTKHDYLKPKKRQWHANIFLACLTWKLKWAFLIECYSSVHPFVLKPSYLLVETIGPFQANLGQSFLG